MSSIDRIKHAIRDVPDFPKKGIIFKDITPVLKNAERLRETIDLFSEAVADQKIDYVAAVEARGFIFGSLLAAKLGCGFIPIRKPGKLPYKCFKESYELEYGHDALEIHQDAIEKGSQVLIIDDLLATGGTALAAAKLIEKCGGQITALLFLIELTFLKGKDKLDGYPVKSFIEF